MGKELIRNNKLLIYKPTNAMCFFSKGQLVNIPIVEITHINKMANETVIYTKTNSYVRYHSLQELLNEPPVNDFFRVHQKHIVNLHSISSVSVNTIKVNGCSISVSAYFKQQLKEEWKDLMKAFRSIQPSP